MFMKEVVIVNSQEEMDILANYLTRLHYKKKTWFKRMKSRYPDEKVAIDVNEKEWCCLQYWLMKNYKAISLNEYVQKYHQPANKTLFQCL